MLVVQYCLLLMVVLQPLSISAQNNSTKRLNTIQGDVCVERHLDLRTILYIIMLVCVFIVGMISNCFAVTVMFLSRSLRRHPTNLLVASLNVCDIGVILCSIPLRLDQIAYENFCFDIHVCRFFNMTDLLFHISSISHLFVIAIERFIAVRIPFFHRYSVNTKTITKAIAFTWFYSSLWTGVGLFNWETPSKESTILIEFGRKRSCMLQNPTYHVVVYVVTYIIPLSFMAIMYILILKTASEHKRRMSENTIHTQAFLNQQQKERSKKQEESISKTVAIIYGTFVFCWLPVTIITIIFNRCPDCFVEFKKSYPIASDAIFTTLIVVLPAVHSCLNPFIYIIFHEKFRTAVSELIGRKKEQNVSSSSTRSASSSKRSPEAIGKYHHSKETIL